MSLENLYEYVQGQFQHIERLEQLPAGTSNVRYILDQNDVKMLCSNIEIFSVESGGVALIEDTDYTLEHYNSDISQTEGVPCFAGYSVINPAYYNTNLYFTSDIYGGYTARQYRPTYSETSISITTSPTSMDDSILVDASSGPIEITLADGARLNQRFGVICTGDNDVTVNGTGVINAKFKDFGIMYVWDGSKWLTLGGSASGNSGSSLKVGDFVWNPGTGPIPFDRLLPDGSQVSIVEYPALFNAYGTLYGGDGITTFGLPNINGITLGAVGTQDINGRTKGDATPIGGIREDQIEQHEHPLVGAQADGGTGSGKFIAGVTTGDTAQFGMTEGAQYPTDARTGEYTRSTELVGQWLIQAYDSIQEVPADPALIPAWVIEYNNPTPQVTPVEYVDNDYSDGLFYFGVSYIFLGEEVRSNGIMAVLIDGIDRTVTLNVDDDSQVLIKYYGDTNRFRAFALGTAFTSVSMVSIYRWDNVASGELNPPVDGWDLVWQDPVPTSPTVPISEITGFGLGKYCVEYFGPTALGRTGYITIGQLSEDTYGPMNSAYDVLYDVSAGTIGSSGSGYYISKIWKFTGLLNVVHTYKSVVKNACFTLESLVDVAIASTDGYIPYNTVRYNHIDGAVLSTNGVTLPPGTYQISTPSEGVVTGGGSGSVINHLRNVDLDVDIAVGFGSLINADTDNVTSYNANVEAEFTLAVTTEIGVFVNPAGTTIRFCTGYNVNKVGAYMKIVQID